MQEGGSGHGNAGAHGVFGVSVRPVANAVVADIESGVADEKNGSQNQHFEVKLLIKDYKKGAKVEWSYLLIDGRW